MISYSCRWHNNISQMSAPDRFAPLTPFRWQWSFTSNVKYKGYYSSGTKKIHAHQEEFNAIWVVPLSQGLGGRPGLIWNMLNIMSSLNWRIQIHSTTSLWIKLSISSGLCMPNQNSSHLKSLCSFKKYMESAALLLKWRTATFPTNENSLKICKKINMHNSKTTHINSQVIYNW